MASPDPISLAHEGTLELAPKVVIGLVDVAAVGARVLLSLEPSAGWTVRETPLELRGLQPTSTTSTSTTTTTAATSHPEGGGEAVRPVLAVAGAGASSSFSPASDAQSAPAVALVRNFFSEASPASPAVSLLILNALIPEEAQAEVAAALLELVDGRGAPAAEASGAGTADAPAGRGAEGGAAPSLTVVAAMLLQHLAQPAALYQHLINGAVPLDAALPPLQPPACSETTAPGPVIRVRDGQLAALLHVVGVSGTPAACLLAPGHKPPASSSPDLPGSAAACDTIGTALAAALGLRYDTERCRTVRALYKWFVPERAAGSDVMYL
ncbi:hypothetical protein PLESTB_000150200 [Pleodorina starrii]|uniref:Uncharacterized protein n=1 Tax=Pleodorina starrii TaxID=330485 RepID=A0A9W6BAY8_9CHLO|nr:hypothetical protein PLESTM_000449000 [Pleodorina starrii]GLC48804.1 hypothetical protein PLESTB_000150200 [Pleodorina starrii]GLC72543.1 hypothetical protein PLESTF_001262700 [Pleodorina starrii]